MSAGHPQIRQGEQRHHLRSILVQSSEVHLRVAKLPFDQAEWVFDLGTDLGLGFLDHAQRFGTALAVFLVGAAPSQDLPDDGTTFMFRTFFEPGIPGVNTRYVFFTLEQSVDLNDVRNIGRRDHQLFTRPDSSLAPMWAFAPRKYWLPFLFGAFPGCAYRPCFWSNSARGSAWHRRWCPGAATGRYRPSSR